MWGYRPGVSDGFLDRVEIFATRGRRAEDTQRLNARLGDLTAGKPLIVLINGGTASGAEIKRSKPLVAFMLCRYHYVCRARGAVMRGHLTIVCTAACIVSGIQLARAESTYAHAYRLCMVDAGTRVNGDAAYYWRLARNVCASFARHPNPNQLAEFESTYDNGGSSAGSAAAAFLGGLVQGYLSGGGPIAHGGSSRSVSPHVSSRVVLPSHTEHLTVAPVSPAPRLATAGPGTGTPTSPSIRQTTSQRTASAGSPAGYITINGQRVPYYSRPPCLTTKQVGPTSYICTNK